MRWLRYLALLVAGGALIWRIADFAHQEYWGSWPLALRGAGLAVGLYGAAAAILTALLSAVARRTPPLGATATLIITVSLLAALPVRFTYSDGCNEHETTSPVGLVPVLALTRPDGATLSYEQLETLVACGRAVPIAGS